MGRREEGSVCKNVLDRAVSGKCKVVRPARSWKNCLSVGLEQFNGRLKIGRLG